MRLYRVAQSTATTASFPQWSCWATCPEDARAQQEPGEGPLGLFRIEFGLLDMDPRYVLSLCGDGVDPIRLLAAALYGDSAAERAAAEFRERGLRTVPHLLQDEEVRRRLPAKFDWLIYRDPAGRQLWCYLEAKPLTAHRIDWA